ncbi:MAG: RNA-directed DNA polymerase [Deltaproteobacteria bacterium]|nr:RNA-directed DNA polymerase [Deltaproteobacteria bacterium]
MTDSERTPEPQAPPLTLPEPVIHPHNLYLAYKRLQRASDPLCVDRLRLYELGQGRERDIRSRMETLHIAFTAAAWRPSPPLYIYERKTTGVDRVKPRLTLLDALIYQAIANLIPPLLAARGAGREGREGEAPRVSYSSILTADAARGLELVTGEAGGEPFTYFMFEPYYPNWRAYKDAQLACAAPPGGPERWALNFDLSVCFDNINHHLLCERLEREVGLSEDVTRVLRACLDTWQGSDSHATRGVGLPQGLDASYLLGELYLRGLDERLRALSGEGYAAMRYVDDVAVVTTSDERAREGALGLRDGPLRALAAYLRGLGLQVNPSKIKFRRIPPQEAPPAPPSAPALSAAALSAAAPLAPAEELDLNALLGARQGQLKQLLSQARTALYHGTRGEGAHERRGALAPFAALALQVARAEETLVAQSLRALCRLAHDEALLADLVGVAGAHPRSPCARYAVYHHVTRAVERDRAQVPHAEGALLALCAVERAAPSSLGLMGLLELAQATRGGLTPEVAAEVAAHVGVELRAMPSFDAFYGAWLLKGEG